ncbi:beta-porphyranase A-like [Haliotis rufescens]|uniref:beta-porphyranase A-like n=1 Tax=Haliotis rufescens TaxID=6454 RepID=UPI00201ED3B0|nr:beta-porphyranase A-like [Haliotis rufescens]
MNAVELKCMILFVSVLSSVRCDYTVSIYPEILKIGKITHFDHGRWNGKNGLDTPASIPHVKEVGATAARWLNRDLAGGLFQKAPENPNKKGYPDPKYFQAHQNEICTKYLDNVNGYQHPEVVMEVKGLNWPHWLDTSAHHGFFPNNIDAAAEFVFLLIDAVNKGTNGKPPQFFEVINEPDAQGKNTNWTTYVKFHLAVAQKIKAKYPNMKIGGPTLTGASSHFDRYDFRIWKRVAEFLDMALTHLDFFSFHSYTNMDVTGGSHHFHRNSEAKIFGLLDLVESYSHKKKGTQFNVIVSEFGLGPLTGIDVQKPSTFLDWAYIYQHNSQIFTFLQRRDVMRKVVAFLLTYTELKGQASINYSILDKNHNERDIAQAFKFWKNFHKTMTYLRVDSQFHNAERKIVPHVLVDQRNGSLSILLHNNDQKPNHVTLHFDKGWFHPTSGKSTCEYLNAQKKPTLDTDTPVHVTNSMVTVPAEASCYFQFHTTHNFAHAPTVTQNTYYSPDMVVPIHNTVVDVEVNVPPVGNIDFVRLRVSVSFSMKSPHQKLKTVVVNTHTLTSFYSLHTHNGPDEDTVWNVFEYNVPNNMLQQHNNDVKLSFSEAGGYLSTVAVIVGSH